MSNLYEILHRIDNILYKVEKSVSFIWSSIYTLDWQSDCVPFVEPDAIRLTVLFIWVLWIL